MMKDVQELIFDLKRLPGLEAVLLGGSRGAGRNDETSDYDFYIYGQSIPTVEVRREIIGPHVSEMEWDNRFWETEDDGRLNNGVEVEFIYRTLSWLEDVVSRAVEGHQASTGYTTCFWANLMESQILHDPQGRASELQNRFRVDYPPELRRAIVQKNRPLLSGSFPSYLRQIRKAVDRHDWNSVNHRVSAFLASYFDILFAVNGRPHPGEKRLEELAAELPLKPRNFREDFETLWSCLSQGPGLPAHLEMMVKRLDEILDVQPGRGQIAP